MVKCQSTGDCRCLIMNILSVDEIVTDINQKCFSLKEIFLLSQKMEVFCVKNKIQSLSAVQVGYSNNFFIYTIDYKNYRYMLDCKYEPVGEDKFISIEACYSIEKNQKRYEVNRYKNIFVEGKEFTNFELIDFKKEFSIGLESCIFQHEIDHYQNKSINQIGKEIHIQQRIKI